MSGIVMAGHSQEFPDSIKKWGCLVGTLLLAGCASSATNMNHSSSISFPFSWGKTASQTGLADSASESSQSTPPVADSASSPPANPFRPEQATNAQLASVSQAGPAGNQIPGKTENSPQAPRFDSATMMLIETEFKDATAEERRQWFEELRQVPPELVPRILRMRRLTQQAATPEKLAPENTPQNSPQQNQIPETPLVAGTTPAMTAQGTPPSQAASANQLKSLTPWDTTPESITQPAQTLQAGGTVAGQIPPVTTTSHESLKTTESTPATTPSSSALEENYQTTLEQLISLSEQRLATLAPGTLEEERLHYASQHAYLRMLYLMANRQERALEAIPRLPTGEQEFWQQMFWGISSYFDSTGIPNPSDRSTHAVSQLTEATTRLRERANLELRNLTFCQKIDGFGNYERFERDEFRPGQPVLVYAEMRNFLSEPTSDGQFKTILKSTIEIHRAGSQGGLVTRQDFAPTEDQCRNRRLDYFHSYMINIPERVTVGPHVLKLIVEDQLNRKVASYSVNFNVQ